MDSQRSIQVPSNGRRNALVLGVLASFVALIVGVWVGRALLPKEERSTSESPSDKPTGGSQVVINGVPLGYERTETGAVQAATNFGRVMAGASDDSEAYRDALRTLAAPGWVSEAEQLADNGLRFLNERYGAKGSLTFVPLRYRVVSYSSLAATVELWGVTVASGPKVQGIDESWITGTVDLVWVSGDWRVAGQSSETGPTPELLQAEEGKTAGDLRDFQEYQHAPAP